MYANISFFFLFFQKYSLRDDHLPERCEVQAIAINALKELHNICSPNLIVEFNVFSDRNEWERINV